MAERRAYTDEDLTLIASLLALGLRHKDVAVSVGRSPKAIAQIIGSGRLPIIVADRVNTDDERRPWQAAEDSVLDILTRRGWKADQIAALLSRTESAVHSRKVRKGVVGPRHPSKQRPEGSWRPCMCCRQTFRSEGIHNRLCVECKANDGDTRDFYR